MNLEQGQGPEKLETEMLKTAQDMTGGYRKSLNEVSNPGGFKKVKRALCSMIALMLMSGAAHAGEGRSNGNDSSNSQAEIAQNFKDLKSLTPEESGENITLKPAETDRSMRGNLDTSKSIDVS